MIPGKRQYKRDMKHDFMKALAGPEMKVDMACHKNSVNNLYD